MSRKTAIIVSLLFIVHFQSQADVGSDIASFFDDVGSQIADSINSFFTNDTLTTIGETFGIVPEDYVYSYAVWNDSNVPIYTSQQGMTAFLGGTFPNALGMTNVETVSPWTSSNSGITLTKTLDGATSAPAISGWQDSSGTLTVTNEQMLFNLYISDKNPSVQDITSTPLYLDQIQTLSEESSTKVYHYRAYNSREWSEGKVVHVPRVELLGYSQVVDSNDDTTPQPSVTVSGLLSSLVFFNNTPDDVSVSFNYGSSQLIITLEGNSFNKFSASDAKMSLRPNNFSFYESGSSTPFTTVPFADVGIEGDVYTLEIFQDSGETTKSVGLQGLSLGNYDTPVSNRVRDVTPVPCSFWWKSVAQYADANGLSDDDVVDFVDLPGQVWVVYNSKDYPIMSKVSFGQAVSWNLLRPTLGKSEDYIYFVYIQTTDDSAAQSFISEFVYGDIGGKVKSSYSSDADQIAPTVTSQLLSSLSSTSINSLSSEQEVATLAGSLDYDLGAMTDRSGTVGYLVGADYFASVGIGSGGQNYVLSPSMYNLSTLVGAFSMYITPPSDLSSQLQQWVVEYVQSPSSVQSAVENLVIQNGKSNYVAGGSLTDLGSSVVQLLLTGPVSLQNPSIDMTVVQNQYVYSLNSSAPSGMPAPGSVDYTEIPLYTAQN